MLFSLAARISCEEGVRPQVHGENLLLAGSGRTYLIQIFA